MLLALRRGVVPTLLRAAAVGVAVALAGGPLPAEGLHKICMTGAPVLHGVLKSASDHEAMDIIAIALALGVFAALALLIEGLERV